MYGTESLISKISFRYAFSFQYLGEGSCSRGNLYLGCSRYMRDVHISKSVQTHVQTFGARQPQRGFSRRPRSGAPGFPTSGPAPCLPVARKRDVTGSEAGDRLKRGEASPLCNLGARRWLSSCL